MFQEFLRIIIIYAIGMFVIGLANNSRAKKQIYNSDDYYTLEEDLY
jgi:hypothetical protein